MQIVQRLVPLSHGSDELKKYCANVMVEYGASCQANGSVSRALELYSDALALWPTTDSALFHMGVLAWEQGRKADALFLYKRAVSVGPTNVHVRSLLLWLVRPRNNMHGSPRQVARQSLQPLPPSASGKHIELFSSMLPLFIPCQRPL
jgi:tetratricopeptide (TPR) repeat protein